MINELKNKFVFFGTSRFSVLVLDELEKAGLMPVLIVTTPDKPQGRGLQLMASPVKQWARARNIKALDPATLNAAFAETLTKEVREQKIDVFAVVSYGKIIPTSIIDIPPHKTLNVHASLLPKYRGASPLQSAMLDDAKQTGVTIIRLDEKMDHGPIVAIKKVNVNEWPTYEDFEADMAHEGGLLLAETLPQWVAGKIKEQEQDHSQAAYAKKIAKEDGLIDIADLNSNASSDRAYAAFRKIQAFHQWPTAYFFVERSISKNGRAIKDSSASDQDNNGQVIKKIRVKISRASFKGGKLAIERVIPAGSREMDYGDFLKGAGIASIG